MTSEFAQLGIACSLACCSPAHFVNAAVLLLARTLVNAEKTPKF